MIPFFSWLSVADKRYYFMGNKYLNHGLNPYHLLGIASYSPFILLVRNSFLLKTGINISGFSPILIINLSMPCFLASSKTLSFIEN